MNVVQVRPEAEADLLEIALYVRETSMSRAHQLVAQLRRRCDILKRFPMAGCPRVELGEGLRSLSEWPYVIFYKIVDDANVEILAFVHGARDLPAALAARIRSEGEQP